MLTALSKQLMPPWMQSMARRAKLERSLKTFEKRVATHRFGGIELKVSLCDPVGEEWYDHDSGSLAEITFFKESGALKDGAVVFDLGAHQGVVALQLASHVGPTGRVVALEANPHNARVANENVALNHARNLTVLHAAAASRDGTLEFNESLNGQVDGGAGTHGKVQVACRSIDSLIQEFGTPDIVYVDVEGFECAVLDGAGASLGEIPNWFVEVHGGAGLEKFGGSVDKLLGYFPANRFKRHFCRSDEGPFIPLSETGSLEGTRWFFIATRI